jgi:hypothetical protein
MPSFWPRQCETHTNFTSYAHFVTAVGFVLACVLASTGTALAASARCPNAQFRVGRSAGLPDCRAYELVTPENLGRTQALSFTGGAGGTEAAAAGDGEAVVLYTLAPLEPNASAPTSYSGARDVFSRNPGVGWETKSIVAPGTSGYGVAPRLYSPDLTRVAIETLPAQLNVASSEIPPYQTLEVGPVGGPYTAMATVLSSTPPELLGASADLGHVLFTSADHELPLSGAPEEAAAKETDSHANDLYAWSDGRLQLTNAWNGKLVNRCGAVLGAGFHDAGITFETVNAVSSDGSRIFFTAPEGQTEQNVGEPGCDEPGQLYMRADDGEPIDVATPEPGVQVSTVSPVRYNFATPDGSKVFFNTEMALTSDDTSNANKLFEYDADGPEGKRLKRIASGVPAERGVGLPEAAGFIFSEDGSTVYVVYGTQTAQEITRYSTITGEGAHVAHIEDTAGQSSRSYSTSNGEFFLFPGKRVENDPRGAGHLELYRYSHADGSVICVTCGTGVAPEQGRAVTMESLSTVLETPDALPAVTEISENGQEVFFETSAQLVPQDQNSTAVFPRFVPGMDVYEWEADEAGGCELAQGCTYLLSSGEASGPSTLIDASANGDDVFFESPAQLLPQATPEFPNIYDARVDGGFAPPPRARECLSCQGVGSPPPLFSPGASGTFTGVGNPGRGGESKPPPPSKKAAAKTVKCKRGFTRKHNKCLKRTRKKQATKANKGPRR